MLDIIIFIITALNIIVYLYIIFAVAKRWRVSKSHRRFLVLEIAGFLWLVAVFLMTFSTALGSHILLVKINFSLAPFVAGFFALFILHFPDNNKRITFNKELLFLLPPLALSVLSFVGVFINVKEIGIYVPNIAYYIYLLLIAIYFIGFGVYVTLKKYKKIDLVSKRKLKLILIGYGAVVLILFADSAYNNIYGYMNITLDRAVLNSSSIFTIFAAYAMLRYRFLNVRFVVRKGIIYGISLVITLAVYTYLALLFKSRIEESWNISPAWTTIILIALVALGFPPLKALVARVINSLFKDKKSIDLAVKELREKISQKTDIDILREVVENEVKKYLEVPNAKLFLLNKKEQTYSHENGSAERITSDNPLIEYAQKHSEVLVLEELQHRLEENDNAATKVQLGKASKEMKKQKWELIMPFRTEEEVFGLLIIEETKEGEAYSVQDIRYLEQLREQTAVTLANALLYQEAMERIGAAG